MNFKKNNQYSLEILRQQQCCSHSVSEMATAERQLKDTLTQMDSTCCVALCRRCLGSGVGPRSERVVRVQNALHERDALRKLHKLFFCYIQLSRSNTSPQIFLGRAAQLIVVRP